MQQVAAENSRKDVLVLIDYKSALLPFVSQTSVNAILEDISRVGEPIITANNFAYISLIYTRLLTENILEPNPDAMKEGKPAALPANIPDQTNFKKTMKRIATGFGLFSANDSSPIKLKLDIGDVQTVPPAEPPKKPAVITISLDGKVQHFTSVTQIMIDSDKVKYGRSMRLWGKNPKVLYPKILILPEHDGLPVAAGFEKAAAEYGFPLARTVYVTAEHNHQGMTNAMNGGACVLSAAIGPDAKNAVVYRPFRPDSRAEFKAFAEVIKDVAVPA